MEGRGGERREGGEKGMQQLQLNPGVGEGGGGGSERGREGAGVE